jgi:hypothetical protein
MPGGKALGLKGVWVELLRASVPQLWRNEPTRQTSKIPITCTFQTLWSEAFDKLSPWIACFQADMTLDYC